MDLNMFRQCLCDMRFQLDYYVKEFVKYNYAIDDEILGSSYGSISKIYDEINNLRRDIDIIEDQI